VAERLGMEWVDSDSRKKLETQITRRVFNFGTLGSLMMDGVIINQKNLLLKALFL